MSRNILILGDSGTGKSTSIRNLPPEETFIINVLGKDLPFKKSSENYSDLSSDGLTGNYYCSDDVVKIRRVLKLVNDKRTEIKYLVIDDCGFILMREFMRRALEKGYEKFTVIAKSYADLINAITELRNDLFCFVMMHIETDNQGKTKPKTVGKMTDQYVVLEAVFTYVLHSVVADSLYKFMTNTEGLHMCKTPLGMFEDQYIDNDLKFVVDQINNY